MTKITPTKGSWSSQGHQLNTAYMCTQFYDCSTSRSRAMIGAAKFKIDSVTVNTAI